MGTGALVANNHRTTNCGNAVVRIRAVAADKERVRRKLTTRKLTTKEQEIQPQSIPKEKKEE